MNFSLKVGDVLDAAKLNLLEASLRTAARRKGRYLSTYGSKPSEDSVPHFMSCNRGHAACSFFLRFSEKVTGTLVCTEITGKHSCKRVTGEEPGMKLRNRMAAFVSTERCF